MNLYGEHAIERGWEERATYSHIELDAESSLIVNHRKDGTYEWSFMAHWRGIASGTASTLEEAKKAAILRVATWLDDSANALRAVL